MSNKQFRNYSSIENAYQRRVIDSISRGYDDGVWIVLEKVHGANSCVIVDKDTISYGKRRSALTEDEASHFYNSLEVFQKYHSSAQKLWELLNHDGPIIIYGELMGGSYPSMERPTKSTVAVQKGVHYCPHNEFYAFDIYLVDEETFVDYDSCVNLFERAGFVYAAPLFRGSFSQALQWSQEHNADQTTIPKLFGYPELEDNIREGHIIKPVLAKFLANKSRVILKDKNSRFSEVGAKSRRFAGSEPPARQRRGGAECPEALQAPINDALRYVTNIRLDNLLSKEGAEITRKNVGRLMGLLTQDALKDWRKDWEGDPIRGPDKKYLTKVLTNESRRLVCARL